MVRRILKLMPISFMLPLLIILLVALIFTPLAFFFPKIFNLSNISTQPYNLLVGILTASVTLLAISALISSVRTRKEFKMAQTRIEEKLSTLANKPVNSALERKKRRLLNLSTITFHYINHRQIEDLYNQFFNEPIIEKIISERTGETGEDIKGQLRAFPN